MSAATACARPASAGNVFHWGCAGKHLYRNSLMRRTAPTPWKPTKAEIAAAHGKKVPDVIAHRLRVLFCGINPGLYSGAVGHHFARPGNRFWPTLYAAGFTDRLLSPFEERELLSAGVGITNLVERATAGAGEVATEELRVGATRLERK